MMNRSHLQRTNVAIDMQDSLLSDLLRDSLRRIANAQIAGNETNGILQLQEIIDSKTLAQEVVDLCERERDNDTLKRLQKLIRENEKATENLLKALDNGQITDVIVERIAQKKKENVELEQQLLLEKVKYPTPKVSEIRFFLSQFKKGDVDDPKYRQGLVDALVNRIFLYDGKMTVLCNTQNGHFDVSLDEKSSSLGHLSLHNNIDTITRLSKWPDSV